MATKSDRLKAELRVEELGEKLVAMKPCTPDDKDYKKYRKLKDDLREARHTFRTLRDATPDEESA